MSQPFINRIFVPVFEDDAQRISNKRYYIPNVEIKDYNVMIDGKNFFDQPIKNDKVTYENTRKIAISQGDDDTTGFLLDYPYFKKYKMIAIDLTKQQALDADPRAIATGQGDDYTTGCLLDFIYLKSYYKMIAVDLSKQQALAANPKAIQQINFTSNLDKAGNTSYYFIHEEARETVFEFLQGTEKVL